MDQEPGMHSGRKISEVFVKGTVPKQCEGHTKLTICKETGKIANEFCTDVEEKTFLVKPAKENTKLWSTNAGDKYNIPTETCDVHKKPEVEKVTVSGNEEYVIEKWYRQDVPINIYYHTFEPEK